LSDTHDPFYVADKAKSISWKDAPVNAKVVMVLDGPATKVRARDYKTGEPASWDDGNPIFNVVLTGDVKGKRRSLWAKIPSNLFFVLGNAQDKTGQKFAKGGELTVEFIGTKPSDNPRFEPAKQYAATYVPPAPDSSGGSDPWSDSDEPPF
jgi:hypothetical protein